MIYYQTLEKISIEALYKTFLEAFSDYAMRFQLSLEDYRNMLKRRGFNPNVSIGAFHDNKLVGFVLNGLREIEGQLTAYDVMTGIVPSSRKQGLSKEMFRFALETFTEADVNQYILEVLQENKTAFNIYQKQGFKIARSFDVFKLEQPIDSPQNDSCKIEFVSEFSDEQWLLLQTFWEAKPSWQNAIQSIKNISEVFLYALIIIEEKIVGYGIVDKKTGDVPQFAVHATYQKHGIEQQLFSALLNKTEKTVLSLTNIDTRLGSLIVLLQDIGFKRTTSQYEMIKELD
jgi:ribosomal protein S18 acetylase RimI-like enzyme